MNLQDWPRPKNDNGRGVHFVLDDRDSVVQHYAPFMQQMQMRWATVYGGDEQQCIKTALYLFQNYGIVSVMRAQATGDQPKAPSFWAAFAQKAVAAGLAPYIQIFNEPEDGRESFNDPTDFANKWGPRAAAVVANGGYCGLQVLSKEFMAPVLAGISPSMADKLFFVLHNYGANHPPIYPYPAKTVFDDDTAVLRFLEYAGWMKDALGFVPPIIGGEGGWLYQNHDDNTMPEVTADLWIAWHREMFDWFRTGLLSNGDPLPDYLFSVHPWLLYAPNWYSDSWVDGLDAPSKQPLIAALAADAPYVRKFSWDNPNPPPPPPPPQPDAIWIDPRIAAAGIQMQVTQGAKYLVTDVLCQPSDALPVPGNSESEAQPGDMIYVIVQDVNGKDLNLEQVTMFSGADDPVVNKDVSVATTSTVKGMCSFQMSGGSAFDPKVTIGPQHIRVGDATVAGAGLPVHRHWSWIFRFVKQP